MENIFQVTKKNLKIIKEKSFIRRHLLAKSLELRQPSDSVNIFLSEPEKNTRKLLKKAKKIKSEQSVKLIEENIALQENEINSIVNDMAELDDDLNDTEENEGPKNDYNQYFVDIGHRPQNFIRDSGLNERFEEYPKLKELIRLKDELISKTNLPPKPMYFKCPLTTGNSNDFPLHDYIGCEFDVILVEPPLLEYQSMNGVHFDKFFTWDEIKAIDVGAMASQRSFIFLWCGSGDGLDKGRECLKKWGFRRCEDICWIKTNKNAPEHNRNMDASAIFQRTKEHCLMGIKGTVRRSVDSNFIHTNIDIDLIITEEPEYGRADKPEEIFHIIEHFCLGKRRLYLFGRDSTIRPGWLTVGTDLSESNFDKAKFKEYFDTDPNSNLTGSTERIEMLRPKTPPIKAKLNALSQISSNPNQNTSQLLKPIQPDLLSQPQQHSEPNNYDSQVFNYNHIQSASEIQPNQYPPF